MFPSERCSGMIQKRKGCEFENRIGLVVVVTVAGVESTVTGISAVSVSVSAVVSGVAFLSLDVSGHGAAVTVSVSVSVVSSVESGVSVDSGVSVVGSVTGFLSLNISSD